MGRKKIEFNAVEKAKTKVQIVRGTLVVKRPKGLKKQVADGSASPSSTMQSNTLTESEKKRKSLALAGREKAEQQQSHDLEVKEEPHDLDLEIQEVSSLSPSSGDELSSSEIFPSGNLDDVDVVREMGGVVCLKGHSGEEVRLDPIILFADLSEADRSRLLRVFKHRPDTFMHMGSLGPFFVHFALESFSRMWGMLEKMKIGHLSEEDLDDLSKIVEVMRRCSVKTDWLESNVKRIWRLKKAKLERTERLKTIGAEREKARAEIEELKVLLSKAEEKEHKLDEEAHALDAPSEGDIALEWSVVQGLFGSE